MKVLVINSGSSSLKYQLVETVGEVLLCKGLVERIGLKNSVFTHIPTNKEAFSLKEKIRTHEDAVKLVLSILTHEKYGVILSMDEIDAVGHRVVHGGNEYSQSQIITDEVMDVLQECAELAPLHNPANLMGIIATEMALPNTD